MSFGEHKIGGGEKLPHKQVNELNTRKPIINYKKNEVWWRWRYEKIGLKNKETTMNESLKTEKKLSLINKKKREMNQ